MVVHILNQSHVRTSHFDESHAERLRVLPLLVLTQVRRHFSLSMHLHVGLQLLRLPKRSRANFTHIRLLASVDQEVSVERIARCEALVAPTTLVGLFSSVEARVSYQVVLEAETLAAVIAQVRLLLGMSQHVLRQRQFVYEAGAARLALGRSFLVVLKTVSAKRLWTADTSSAYVTNAPLSAGLPVATVVLIDKCLCTEPSITLFALERAWGFRVDPLRVVAHNVVIDNALLRKEAATTRAGHNLLLSMDLNRVARELINACVGGVTKFTLVAWGLHVVAQLLVPCVAPTRVKPSAAVCTHVLHRSGPRWILDLFIQVRLSFREICTIR